MNNRDFAYDIADGVQLAAGLTVAGAFGPWVRKPVTPLAFVATVEGTGAVTAQFQVQFAVAQGQPVISATIDLSGTTVASDGYSFDEIAPYPWVRIALIAISGTGAKGSGYMGFVLPELTAKADDKVIA